MAKNLLIFMALFFISCSGKSPKLETQGTTALPVDLPSSNWIEVVLRNGTWVVFRPCDAEPFQLTMDKEKNSIVIQWGQMQDVFRINDFIHNADSSLTITTTTGSGDSSKFDFNYKQTGDRSSWKIKDYNRDQTQEKYLIQLKDTTRFSFSKQPCEECWDKAICDSLYKTRSPK